MSAKPDREAVKTLAIAVGVREAARQTGLNENTVRQWSSRYKWFAIPPQPPTQQVTTVTSPSVALADSLAKLGTKTKYALAKASNKAAEYLGSEEVTPAQILKAARSMKEVASTAQMVHGWNESKQGSGTLNLNVLGGQTAIQVVQGPASPDASE